MTADYLSIDSETSGSKRFILITQKHFTTYIPDRSSTGTDPLENS